jgi:hypothetical protein
MQLFGEKGKTLMLQIGCLTVWNHGKTPSKELKDYLRIDKLENDENIFAFCVSIFVVFLLPHNEKVWF